MFNAKIAKQSLFYAGGALAYIMLVAIVMSNVERFLGQKEDGPLAPVGFLLLLVVSAATMGLLIFGKPVMLYIDGKKRDGVTMVICTIASLAVFTALVFVTMAFI